MTYILIKNKKRIIFSLIAISLLLSYFLFQGSTSNTIPSKAQLVFKDTTIVTNITNE